MGRSKDKFFVCGNKTTVNCVLCERTYTAGEGTCRRLIKMHMERAHNNHIQIDSPTMCMEKRTMGDSRFGANWRNPEMMKDIAEQRQKINKEELRDQGFKI